MRSPNASEAPKTQTQQRATDKLRGANTDCAVSLQRTVARGRSSGVIHRAVEQSARSTELCVHLADRRECVASRSRKVLSAVGSERGMRVRPTVPIVPHPSLSFASAPPVGLELACVTGKDSLSRTCCYLLNHRRSQPPNTRGALHRTHAVMHRALNNSVSLHITAGQPAHPPGQDLRGPSACRCRRQGSRVALTQPRAGQRTRRRRACRKVGAAQCP